MQKGLFFLVSFLFISICHCQVSFRFLDRKILIKNHVRKVIQVNKTDTTSCYAVFNEKGLVIISNKYNYQYNEALGTYNAEEEIIYRYYDEDGKIIGQVNQVPNSENPIKNIFLHSDDTTSKITSYIDFHASTEGEARINLSTGPTDTSQFNQDTVWVTKHHAKVPHFQWEKLIYYEEVKFDSKGRAETAERIELAFKPDIYEHEVKTSYNYDKNGNLSSKTETRFDEKGKHYETDEFYYSDNGLLNKVFLKNKRDNKVQEFEFIYEYRN